MKENIQESLEIYKKQLEEGHIQIAYISLMKLISKLKSEFPSHYQTGNISPGYLDYTYFPFFNDYLRNHKLRFGIVLNHKNMQFELWLMGQNINIQKKYWNILKNTVWNHNKEMPKYSIVEVVLENKIDFNSKERMIENIIEQSVLTAIKIQEYLKKHDN